MGQEQIRQYTLLRKLGDGRHGETWQAVDAAIQRTLVIKFLPPALGNDPDFQLRFLQEIERINDAHHDNLAAVYTLDTEDMNRPFITREFIEGENLRDHTGGDPMFYHQFLNLVTQVARGVKAAHGVEIALRNLSPNNILVTEKGQVRIVDFCLDWPGLVPDGPIDLEVLRYRSPEQLLDQPPLLGSDLFTLGSIYYELLTGEPAYPQATDDDLRAAIADHGPEFTTLASQRIPSDARLLIEQLTEPEIEERMPATVLVSSLEGMLSYHIHSLDDTGPAFHHRSPRKYLSLSLLAVLLVIFWLVITTVYK